MSNTSNDYFASISAHIDRMEGRSNITIDSSSSGEVDGGEVIRGDDLGIKLPESGIPDIPALESIPTIPEESIDGIINLYNSLNEEFGLDFNVDSITSINETFKAIVDPNKRDIFQIYMREGLDRLQLACLSQISNTIYRLIGKLTSEESLQTMTIQEQIDLLDRMFEYIDKIQGMVKILPKGNSNLELKDISENSGDTRSSSNKLDRAKVSAIINYLTTGEDPNNSDNEE